MEAKHKPTETPKRKKHPDHYESPVMQKTKDCACTLPNEGKGSIQSDVQGSYTGTPVDFDVPEQDADDI